MAILSSGAQGLDPPCQTGMKLGVGRQQRRLPSPCDNAMPSRSVGPADTSFGVLHIERKAHGCSIASGWYNDRECLECTIERQLKALGRHTLTEPWRHVSCHDPHWGRAAKEYLDEQRLQAGPDLKQAIDRIWERIEAEDR